MVTKDWVHGHASNWLLYVALFRDRVSTDPTEGEVAEGALQDEKI